jgi:preprotein translocase subunit SecF
MSNNLDELKGLVAAIATDRQSQKDKEKRDAWTKYVSLSMICLAVLAAIATQRGAGFSSATMKQLNEATFNQAEASDQWSFYQAKGIKKAVTDEEKEVLVAAGNADAKLLADLGKKSDRYGNEQNDIKAEAEKFEAKRNDARTGATLAADRGREMGLATTIFQISIALGGVCLVVKKRWLWYVSLGTGALAAAQMFKTLVM